MSTEKPKFGVGEYATRDGSKATVCFVRDHPVYPLVGWIEDKYAVTSWSSEGVEVDGVAGDGDLVPEQPEHPAVAALREILGPHMGCADSSEELGEIRRIATDALTALEG